MPDLVKSAPNAATRKILHLLIGKEDHRKGLL
jgi:hypothetical protein